MTQALNMVLAQLSPRLRRTVDNVETMVGTIEEVLERAGKVAAA